MTAQDAQSLLARLRNNRGPGGAPDQAAWAQFVELYSPLLYCWACRLEQQETDALDLVQEVFLLLHQKLPEFRHDPRQSFRNWLATVLYNKWRDRWRLNPPPMPADPQWLAQIPTADPLEAFTEMEYQRYLIRRVMDLIRTDFETTTWQAFWESLVQGRPATEVASELHLSLAAVYQAISRVRRRLRQELGELLD